MIAYEFSTILAANGHLSVPGKYTQEIPPGSIIRVLLLVEESVPVKQNGQAATDRSLEELVARIKSKPIEPNLITPASGLLAEHLANPLTKPDPNFDEKAWNEQWAQIEAEMDAIEQTEEEARLREMMSL